jgi:tripartite ATP-independent transporter DctM subunit
MSATTIGIIGVIVLLVLLFSRMHIAFAMGIVGFAGICVITDIQSGLALLDTIPYRMSSGYTLSTLPLFILMGQFAWKAGMSEELYETMRIWLGRLPGGLAIATIGGCAGFAATSGSSLATAATMATVSLPQMRKYGYNLALATGCIASGGTLGILIPPSIGFILYGIITEVSIGKLFIAGILPGILLTLLFMLTIFIITRMDPKSAPRAAPSSMHQKIVSLKSVWPIAILFILVIGGIYGGWFTSTEAGAIGASGALVIGLARRRISRKSFVEATLETGKVTAMIFIVIIGASILSTFFAASDIPSHLANAVAGLAVPPTVILTIILVFYIFLGALMDIVSGLVLTMPIVYPVMLDLGYDPIWFGVIFVLMFEIGVITPPVGINVFVIKGVVNDIPLATIFRGIVPFFLAMLVCVIVLILFPAIATYLPGIM